MRSPVKQHADDGLRCSLLRAAANEISSRRRGVKAHDTRLMDRYRPSVLRVPRNDEVTGASIRVGIDKDQEISLVVHVRQPLKVRIHGAGIVVPRFERSCCYA
jgi:hypothetical protein